MRTLVAIDPGEKHCGVAVWEQGKGAWSQLQPYEVDPYALFYMIAGYEPHGKVTVVMEEYKLYPWLLQQQGFSAVKTVETIGVVRWLCHCRDWTLVEQSATIKKPATGFMQTKGIEFRGTNQHMRDAEMHGWYWILKEDWSAA